MHADFHSTKLTFKMHAYASFHQGVGRDKKSDE